VIDAIWSLEKQDSVTKVMELMKADQKAAAAH
jgi:hypothetical protein